jgi:hypothetical protein
MTLDNFPEKGCDARDLAVLWPCGPQTGFVPLPHISSQAASEEEEETES